MGRASNRQRRAREQLEDLEFSKIDTKDQSSGEEDDEHDVQPSGSNFSTSINTFASLLSKDEAEGEDLDSQMDLDEDPDVAEPVLSKQSGPRKKSKSKKKGKNKGSGAISASNAVQSDPPFSPNTSQDSPTDKTKLSNDHSDRGAVEGDEIDLALKELGLTDTSLRVDHLSRSSDGPESLAEIMSLLCSVDYKMLDADQELRRMFGSRVIASALNSTRSSPTPYHARISNNPHHQINLRSKSAFLAKPQPNWPPFDKLSSGLSMRPMTPEEIEANTLMTCPDEVWFTFEHSPRFKATQSKFIKAIMSHDPNRLMAIFQSSPYHPDTLLQLSEVSAQQGDPGQALDFLNRALYSFEKAFNPLFNIGKGLVRLNFSMIENRGLFRAIEKSMQQLAKRGCWRTSFESCKLLYSLSPYDDPYGSLLWMDFLAPKAKQYQYFLDLAKYLPETLPHELCGLNTTEYPGFAYAKALCMWHLEEEKNESHCDSSDALEIAIVRFPQVIPPLADKLGISLPVTFSTVERAVARTSYIKEGHLIHLQSHIYVNRSADLWKEPGVLSWLQSVITGCHERLDDEYDMEANRGKRLITNSVLDFFNMGIYRTVVLSDITALKRFLPPGILETTQFSFDPLPPKYGSRYDLEYFDSAEHSNDPSRQQAGRPGPMDEDNVVRDIFNELLNVGDIPRHPAQMREQIQQVQLQLQVEDDRLSPEQRAILLELLDALLLELRERDQEDGSEDEEEDESEEDEDEESENENEEDETDREARQEPDRDGLEGISSDEPRDDRGEVAMPGSFYDELGPRHPPSQPESDSDPARPGVMDRIWGWMG